MLCGLNKHCKKNVAPSLTVITVTISYVRKDINENKNSTNIDDFIKMIQSVNPDITDVQIIEYLEHIGRLTPKAKSNGDKSCVDCGAPGIHQSKITVDRNTERIDHRCDGCYQTYQKGQGLRS